MPRLKRRPCRHRWSRYARFLPGPRGGLVAFSGATGAALSLVPPSSPSTASPEDAGRSRPPKSRARRRGAAPRPRPDRFDEEGRRCLMAAGLLVEAGHDEVLAVKNRTCADWHLATELVLNISPTLACNLRCTYCFQACGPSRRDAAPMSREVAEQVVAFAAAHLEGCKTLVAVWFGGEPLLSLPLIEELGCALREEAARRGAQFKADLFTNGVLLTPDAARRLAAAGVEGAVIAVDGPPQVHDSRRLTAQGGPTFATIWPHLGPASEHMDVIVQTMVDRANAAHAWDVRDLLAKEGLADRVHFRVARVRAGPRPRSELTPREFGRLQLEGLRRYRNSPEFGGLPAPRFGCSYRRERAFVIEPSGRLQRCTRTVGRPEWAVGHVATGVLPGSAAATRWLAADPFRRRRCRRCPVLPLCGGGCALELAQGRMACTPTRWTLDGWLREWAAAAAGGPPQGERRGVGGGAPQEEPQGEQRAGSRAAEGRRWAERGTVEPD